MAEDPRLSDADRLRCAAFELESLARINGGGPPRESAHVAPLRELATRMDREGTERLANVERQLERLRLEVAGMRGALTAQSEGLKDLVSASKQLSQATTELAQSLGEVARQQASSEERSLFSRVFGD